MVGLEGLCWLAKGTFFLMWLLMAAGAITGGVLFLVMFARAMRAQESMARSLERLASK